MSSGSTRSATWEAISSMSGASATASATDWAGSCGSSLSAAEVTAWTSSYPTQRGQPLRPDPGDRGGHAQHHGPGRRPGQGRHGGVIRPHGPHQSGVAAAEQGGVLPQRRAGRPGPPGLVHLVEPAELAGHRQMSGHHCGSGLGGHHGPQPEANVAGQVGHPQAVGQGRLQPAGLGVRPGRQAPVGQQHQQDVGRSPAGVSHPFTLPAPPAARAPNQPARARRRGSSPGPGPAQAAKYNAPACSQRRRTL